MTRNAKYKLEPRYGTPPDYVEMARTALGGRIELDPMSEAIFNSVVGAERIWTAEDDCFRQDFTCETMLLNAAGGLVVRAWQRMVSEWSKGNVGRAVWIGFNLEQLSILADEAMHPLDFSLLITRKRIDFLSAELQPITRQVSWIDEPIADIDAELRPSGSPSNANYIVGLGIDPGLFETAFSGRGRFNHGKHAVRRAA